MTAALTPASASPPADIDHRPDSVAATRALAWLLTLAGLVGLAASAILTLDKIHLLENPGYVPSCNINPIISCGSVMRTHQAAVFGFPNPLIGLAAFPTVLTAGVAALTRVRLPRRFWLGLQAGTVLGLVFVHWLMFQTLYRIGALCPYCMVVWAVTIALFWYVLLHNTTNGVIPVPASWRPAVEAATRWHWTVPATWYLVIALLILNRFWYYWRTLL